MVCLFIANATQAPGKKRTDSSWNFSSECFREKQGKTRNPNFHGLPLKVLKENPNSTAC